MTDKLSAENLAHLEVIYEATVQARNLGFRGSVKKRRTIFNLFRTDQDNNSELIADLMDAIHNTPGQIAKPFCATEEYVRTYYEAFDKKHPNNYISLVGVFSESVKSEAI